MLEARDDKPITKLLTTATRQDGTVALEGTAVCYTARLTAREGAVRRRTFQATGGEPSAVEISSRARFSASLTCLPPIPRKPPSLCALATVCAKLVTNRL